MVDEAGSHSERQALVARIEEEIERDKRKEEEQDYAGLIPEVYQVSVFGGLGGPLNYQGNDALLFSVA